MKARAWFFETRPQFLLLSVVLAFLGCTMAWNEGHFNLGIALLAGGGLVLAHISVNVLNDWFDFRSGIDKKTRRTPFSGGSGILPAGMLTTRQVFGLGATAFVVIAGLGVYFLVTRGVGLLPLLLVAGLCILLYSPVILKTRAPEWAAGLGLGTLPILGTYFVQTASYSLAALVASVPSGFLVYNLLLLNEFPDVDADKIAGRRTLPITEGANRASIVYGVTTIAVYVWVATAVILRQMPPFALIALLTLPLALKAIAGSRHSEDLGRFVPAMASNVMVVLATQLLLGIGYILDRAI